ncbi:MAG TPA: hypothetical protein PLJ35_09015 [Anaerolineae bacterium]|nr:hypothetical protein [Anaerolineae bacterium]
MAQRVTARSTTDLVLRVLREARRPLTVEEILAGVQELAPVHSANPKNTMRKAISQMFLVQPTTDNRYGYLPYLLEGNRFRHPIERGALQRDLFLLGPEIVTALWPATFEIAKRRDDGPAFLRLHGRDGARAIQVYREVEGWGMRADAEFWRWLEGLDPHTGDELIFDILDAEERRYGVRLAPKSDRDEHAIAERNLLLADQAEVLLKAAHDAVILSNLAVRLVGLGSYRHPVPPDPLAMILANDPRFADAGLDMVALADRWPGYPTETVDARRLATEVDSTVPGGVTPELVEVPAGHDEEDF